MIADTMMNDEFDALCQDGGSPRYWMIDGVLVDAENPTPEAIAMTCRFVDAIEVGVKAPHDC